jgi:hypothetical protein
MYARCPELFSLELTLLLHFNINKNIFSTRKTVETYGSVDYGPVERIVSLMSVSQTHMPSPVSPKTPKRSWQLMDERKDGRFARLFHFAPFSTDDRLGKGAIILRKMLSALLAEKWERIRTCTLKCVAM